LEEVAITSDDDVVSNVQDLAHEEHRLRELVAQRVLSQEESARLRWLAERLDQCWDLLRQRKARAAAGLDPDEAFVRPVDTVQHYRQ
jgi:predicted transcriptional regulator